MMNESSQVSVIQSHNLKAAAMWSSGSRAYDDISRGIADGIEHCVLRLAPKPGERVLDVATGTGWASRRVAARGACVTGIDIADGLLEAARTLATEAHLEIDYRLCDAERLPFADEAFDAVISTFGVMFTPIQEAAVDQLVRVCRRGGRMAIAAWRPNSNAVALRQVLQPFMPAPSASPPPSPFNWGDTDWLHTTLGNDCDLGFEEGIAIQRLPDAESAWELYERGFGPVRALAQSLEETRRAELRRVFIDWANTFQSGLGITIPFQYHVTLGRRR
jgi:SAM-dependent methyltransferase